MSDPCAIIAGDVVCSLGGSVEEVWRRMLKNECGLRPLRRLPRGRYLSDIAGEISQETESLIRSEVAASNQEWAWPLSLYVARRVLDRGGTARQRAERTGLILSTTKAEIGNIERMAARPDETVGDHHNAYALARDLAAALGLRGPVFAVSNACASGLVAIVQAARLLRRDDADRMLVVGVDVLSDFLMAGFSSLNALSRDACRPFDAKRTGLSLGEGAAAMLMARAGDSTEPALGTLLGWGVSDDANHITAPSRTGDGLKRALVQALKMSELAPSEIHYINGHGTGTFYNDEMEAKAVRGVFGLPTPPVTSMKGYLGHTLGAAGVIETVLSLTAMRERLVPASMGLQEIGVSEPINIPTQRLPLAKLDHVLTLKCGFGGMNAALVLGRGGAS